MRVFVAIDVHENEIIDRLRQAQESLRRTGADLKLVEPQNLHFTMKFLGEIPDDAVKTVESRLSSIPQQTFAVGYHGLGVFPSMSRVSVVWVGAHRESAEKLNRLASEVERALRGISAADSGRFQPHVTIARVRSGRLKAKLLEEVSGKADALFGEEMVGPLKLKKSELTSLGPIYTDLAVFRFD